MSHVIEQGAATAAPQVSAGEAIRLRNYYLLRALVSAVWVAAAFTVGKDLGWVAALLLIVYPAWDAFANLIDAAGSGGLARNRTQALNTLVSLATALAVAVRIGDMHAVLAIYGGWAIFAGLLQLGTGVRRWKAYGAQWAMVLSGAQSALAGGFFISRSLGAHLPGITDIAPYAAFGAFYFLVSTLWLTFSRKG